MRIESIRDWLLVSLAASLVGCMTPIQNVKWIVVNSEHFEIASTMSPKETTELVTELERFRALIHTFTTAPRVESPVPTRIIAFERTGQFSPFRPSSKVAGYFLPGLRANHVVFADWSASLGATEIIFHEYVHFVLRNGTSLPYPMWYDEGFAEGLSTVQTHEGLLAIGALPRARMDWFRYGKWMSLKRVLETTSYDELHGQDMGMFYAQAWALSHYVALDKLGVGSLDEYISLLQQGKAPVDAYEKAFGESIGATSKTLRRKLQRGDWAVLGIPLDRLDYDRSPPSVRVLSKAEVLVLLGQLQLTRGKGEKAEVLFKAALGLEATNSRAHAGMGARLNFRAIMPRPRSIFARPSNWNLTLH